MNSRLLAFAIALGSAFVSCAGASEGESVLVVYNSNSRESKDLAQYYAAKRQVPAEQIIGLSLPKDETITRLEFRDELQRPLLKKIEKEKWMVWKAGAKASSAKDPSDPSRAPIEAKIRYMVLCYGVPLRILEEPKLIENEMEKVPAQLRRNEAAVDNELALLPLGEKLPLAGLLPNRAGAVTNTLGLSPTNGVLMVARLDGPSIAIARGLIDKALQAEADGLWGRAYFDARGLTNGNTKIGDDWIRGAAEVTRRLGFETVLDEKDERFSSAYPMSHIAFYTGWYEYDGQVSGPFARPTVEFMPGAFAYHLHSFSAQSVRSPIHGWAGPLLQKGATITMGCVHEPFLEFTPNLTIFYHRLIYMGFSFGEAAYASQNFLSWQTAVVGDPLYRPFRKRPLDQHEELVRTKNKLAEWSHLKVVNINLATGLTPDELIAYLEGTAELKKSAVLLEKLGDLYSSRAKMPEACANYRQALQQASSHQQQIRLSLALGRSLEMAGKLDEAYDAYRDFVKSFPDYPDLLVIYRKLVPLSDQLKKASEREQFQKEIERLSGAAAKS